VHPIFNYLLLLLLAAMWAIVFLLPLRKKKRGKSRFLQVVRTAAIWWVLGMAYHLVGFLMPDRSLLGIFDKFLSYTLSLPTRLGIGLENARVGAFASARFDLALAMILGLPFAFFLALIIFVALAAQKRTSSSRQQSAR